MTQVEGPYIETHSGRRFHFMDPVPSEVDIEDIAFSLAGTARWGGHCNPRNTVAQHCVIVSRMLEAVDAPLEEQLRGLLHDAAEAYIPDIPTPIKPFLGNFKQLEKRIEHAVFAAFQIPGEITPLIREMDIEAARWEYRDLMKGVGTLPAPSRNYPTLIPLSPEEAETQFLARFSFLSCALFGTARKEEYGRSTGLDRGDLQDSGEHLPAPRPDTGDSPRGQIHQVENPGIGTGPALVVAGYDGGCHVPGGQASFVFRPAGYPHEGPQDGSG